MTLTFMIRQRMMTHMIRSPTRNSILIEQSGHTLPIFYWRWSAQLGVYSKVDRSQNYGFCETFYYAIGLVLSEFVFNFAWKLMNARVNASKVDDPDLAGRLANIRHYTFILYRMIFIIVVLYIVAKNKYDYNVNISLFFYQII